MSLVIKFRAFWYSCLYFFYQKLLCLTRICPKYQHQTDHAAFEVADSLFFEDE
jgi:hypothetical protein